MDHDYYQVLGVDPSADLEWITTAYRHKASRCHPDRGGSHSRMKLVNEAWEVLSNPDSRLRYDQERAKAERPMAEATRAQAPEAPEPAPIAASGWEIAESLREAIARDFSRAEFPPGLQKWMGGSSMGGNSISGYAFLLAGGMIGLSTLGRLIYMSPSWPAGHPLVDSSLFLAAWFVGGEVATKVHQWLARGRFSMGRVA